MTSPANCSVRSRRSHGFDMREREAAMMPSGESQFQPQNNPDAATALRNAGAELPVLNPGGNTLLCDFRPSYFLFVLSFFRLPSSVFQDAPSALGAMTYALTVLSCPAASTAATPKTQSSMFMCGKVYSITLPTAISRCQSGAQAFRQKTR